MMKRIVLAVFIVLGGITLSAQNYENYRRQQQEAFQSYKNKSQADYDAYRSKVNAEFADFLKQPWERKQAEDPKPEPEKVPDVPPVVMPEISVDLPEDQLIEVDIIFPKLPVQPKPIAPVPYRPKPGEKTLTFSYYGTQGSVRFDVAKKVFLNGTDENAVSKFWKGLSGEAYDNIVADCQLIHADRDLCDWAYYRMTEKLAEALYDTRNEQRVFHAWLLSQSGYSVRLGRDNGKLYLLPGTTALLFNKYYWKMDGCYYSLLEDEKLTSMHFVKLKFPDTSPIRTRMLARNSLEVSSAPGRMLRSQNYPTVAANVSCDQNMLDFLKDIPTSALEGTDESDYLMYAQMPLSEKAGHDLLTVLFDQVEGKSEADAANILINFVQTAFVYKTDGEVWGLERAFFPEETLYYPYSDCEDRAILFCSLVKEVLGLDVAFVSYPGHLAAAVHFSEDIPGDFFMVDGKRYLVCDPTYIHASIGRTMPGMDNATAQVYVW